jgi:phenylacetate-coenzyme A ligase PaaK-like adenylate-forming protein
MDTQAIFNIHDDTEFNDCCLTVFHHQVKNCKVYQDYVQYIQIDPLQIHHYTQIPFLPIELFKTQRIISTDLEPQVTFTSSGTTGMVTSKHEVVDITLYESSFRKTFEQFYGSPSDIAVLALLPSYLERSGSSLIYMVDDLIKQSQQAESGYFLYNHQDLFDTLKKLSATKTKTILFGVTYALLDFVEQYEVNFPSLIIMETGGMKGKRKEMIREEVHATLCQAFHVPSVHSEYGMTELLSQGYSSGQGIFNCPNWLKILIRDTNDPLSLLQEAKTGAINVIDLANIHSCSFIATQDLGRIYADGSFEILGRFDQSDIRGCNLLVQ